MAPWDSVARSCRRRSRVRSRPGPCGETPARYSSDSLRSPNRLRPATVTVATVVLASSAASKTIGAIACPAPIVTGAARTPGG